MSRKSRNYHRSKAPSFGMLPRFMTECAAWKSLSPVAEKAFVAVLDLYRGTNNGRLSISVRMLAEKIGCSRSHAARALIELEKKGFIGPRRSGDIAAGSQRNTT